MKYAVCKIAVTVLVQLTEGGAPVGRSSNATVKGKIKASSDSKYLMDFSAKAKTKPWRGDYSEVLVYKNDCVELK